MEPLLEERRVSSRLVLGIALSPGASHAVRVAQQPSQSVRSSWHEMVFCSCAWIFFRGPGRMARCTWRVHGLAHVCVCLLTSPGGCLCCLMLAAFRPRMPYLCGPQASRRGWGGLWNPMELLARLEPVVFLERVVGMEDPIPASPSTFNLKFLFEGTKLAVLKSIFTINIFAWGREQFESMNNKILR